MEELLAVWVDFTASDRRLQMAIPETECPHVNYIVWPGRFTLKHLLQLLSQCSKKG